MKNPNSYGSISKLSGNRRRPYIVRITTGFELTDDNKAVQKMKVLGYYPTRKEAVMALAEYNRDPYNLDRNNATVEDIWNSIKDKINASDARKSVYYTAWVKYMSPIHKRQISAVKAQELQDIINACPHGYSTKITIRTVMKHIFKYAAQNDYISKDYSAFVTVEREETILQRQIYTASEIDEIWKHAGELLYDFTLILLHQGMRITELRELPLKNIDIEAGTISITKAKNKQSIRTIPINENIKPIMTRCYNNSTSVNLFDFSKHQYEYFVNNVLHHLAYDTRHTFATQANKLGIEKVYIQKIMGHKPETILEQVYTHISIEDLAAQINRIKF